MIAKEFRTCKYHKCDIIFEVQVNSTQKYCSHECYWKDIKGKPSSRKLPREIRICVLPGCDNTFECSTNDPKNYCSRICACKASRGKPLVFKNPKERIKKIGKTKKGKPSWCRGLTKETDERIASRAAKQIGKMNPTNKTKQKIGRKNSKNMKCLWQDPEYREKQLKAIFKGWELLPNRPEKFLDKLFQQFFPNQIKYIGDGKNEDSIIGGKCPDFVFTDGQKKIIEHFGDFHHGEEKTGIPNKQHEQERIAHFAKYGYQTLVVWEHELENVEVLVEKILNFTRGRKNEIKNR